MRSTFTYLTLLILIGASSFYGGAVFGIRQGANLQIWSSGLVKAEFARHYLTSLDGGDIASVQRILEVDLLGGLREHYAFMHYPYKVLIPDAANYVMNKGYDKTFMARIQGYVDTHPGVLDPTAHFDAQKLPETTEEEKAMKEMMLESSKEADDEIEWLLEHYKSLNHSARPQ